MSYSRSNTWVVIAAYNEGKAIGDVVRGVVADGWNVVITDDGSRDDTFTAANVPGATVLRHVINLGQGAALQTGIDYAISRGALAVVTFDADGQHQVSDIPALLEALQSHDVALGSRFLGTIVGATEKRKAFLAAATKVSNKMSGLKLTDSHCGLRAIRATAVPKLRITQDRMAHASELLRKMHASKLRIKEVPVTIHYTEYSMRKGQSGFGAIRIMFDYFFRA